jgi:hypothetical protein
MYKHRRIRNPKKRNTKISKRRKEKKKKKKCQNLLLNFFTKTELFILNQCSKYREIKKQKVISFFYNNN